MYSHRYTKDSIHTEVDDSIACGSVYHRTVYSLCIDNRGRDTVCI